MPEFLRAITEYLTFTRICNFSFCLLAVNFEIVQFMQIVLCSYYPDCLMLGFSLTWYVSWQNNTKTLGDISKRKSLFKADFKAEF